MVNLARSSVVLGVGVGGLFDGIVFHQILQWHHMVSGPWPADTLANLELNTLFDGLFHGAAWVLTLLGLWLVQRGTGLASAQAAGRILVGGILAGWGSFNLGEGILDHYLIGLHHVRPGPDQSLYDAAFLVWGGVFIVLGWRLIRAQNRGRSYPRS